MLKSKQVLVDRPPVNKTLKQSVEEKLSTLLRVDNCSISHLYDNQYMVHFSYPIPSIDSLKSYAKKLELVGINAQVSSSSFMSPQLTFESTLENIIAATDENLVQNKNTSSSSISNTILKKIMRSKA